MASNGAWTKTWEWMGMKRNVRKSEKEKEEGKGKEEWWNLRKGEKEFGVWIEGMEEMGEWTGKGRTCWKGRKKRKKENRGMSERKER